MLRVAFLFGLIHRKITIIRKEAFNEHACEWSACVSGALPEREYLDLVRAAGFEAVQARRSASDGQVEGVEVYNLQVSARKPAGCCGGSGCC